MFFNEKVWFLIRNCFFSAIQSKTTAVVLNLFQSRLLQNNHQLIDPWTLSHSKPTNYILFLWKWSQAVGRFTYYCKNNVMAFFEFIYSFYSGQCQNMNLKTTFCLKSIVLMKTHNLKIKFNLFQQKKIINCRLPVSPLCFQGPPNFTTIHYLSSLLWLSHMWFFY